MRCGPPPRPGELARHYPLSAPPTLPGADVPADAVAWCLPQSASAAPTSRGLLAHALAAWGLTALSGDVAHVAGELVANAVEHGRWPIELRLCRDPDRACCAVFDAGPALPAVRQVDEASLEPGGWSLRIVADLVGRWGVTGCPVGKQVWAAFPLPPRPGTTP